MGKRIPKGKTNEEVYATCRHYDVGWLLVTRYPWRMAAIDRWKADNFGPCAAGHGSQGDPGRTASRTQRRVPNAGGLH
jgi:hypothetical protein